MMSFPIEHVELGIFSKEGEMKGKVTTAKTTLHKFAATVQPVEKVTPLYRTS